MGLLSVEDIKNLDKACQELSQENEIRHVGVINELGRLVIYANSKNGVFAETGELFIDDQFRIGAYERPLHDEIDRSSVLGGYWEIATDNIFTPNTLGNLTDTAYGLVIKDVKNNASTDLVNGYTESSTVLPYKSSIQNRLDNPVEILVNFDVPFQKEVDLIRVLSHKSQGVGGIQTEVDVLDSRYVVRLPKGVSDKAFAATNDVTKPDPYIGVFLNDLPFADGTSPDLTSKGFGDDPFSVINKVQTPIDYWDGYIDYDIFDLDFDLQVGDNVREGQTGATAEVVYYQRDLDKARIYVKNVAGNFSFGSRYIEGIAPQSIWLYKQVGAQLTRVGTVESRQLADDDIGKLAVFQHTSNLEIPPTLTYAISSQIDEIADYEHEFISGVEYLTWVEEFKPGLARNTLPPSTANNDWAETNNIPINIQRDASSFVREGAYFVYQYNIESDQYDLVNGYILPNRENNRYLGRRLKVINKDDLYKLVIAVVVGSFFPVALIERHHISITFLGDAFGDRVNKLLTNFANIMLLGFLILMCWQFTNYVLEVADTGETTWILQWSVAPWWAVATVCIYLCLPVQLLVTIRDMILPSSANQHGNCEPREPKA